MFFGPRLFTVSSSGEAEYSSIYRALTDAVNGDVVVVEAGTYSSATTGEVFPLFVPAGVQLLGAGADECSIVGDESLRTSNRPLDPYESLILLGDDSVLSGFTLENSGANGVSHLQGASFLIERNVIQHNGQHGVLLYGPGEATVRDNRFFDNGTRHYEPLPPPLPISCRQGHHIYFEAKSNCRNAATILSNRLKKSFADGIGLAPSFEERTQVDMSVQVIDNDIEDAERSGILIGGSFGTNETRVSIDIRRNRLQNNTITGIDATGALSLIPRTIQAVHLSVCIVDNEISGSQTGISNISGFGPAEQVLMESWILNNRISHFSDYGIRAVGGMGSATRPACHNSLRSVIANNHIDTGDCDKAIVIEGAAYDDLEPSPVPSPGEHSWLVNNSVVLTLQAGSLPASSIQIKNGPPRNHVDLNTR